MREWVAYLYESIESGKFMVMEAKLMAEVAIKLTPLELKTDQAFVLPTLQEQKPPPPPHKTIAVVPRLVNDVQALGQLFESKEPTQVLLQASRVYTILYGFADASGSGFGSTVMLEGNIMILYRHLGLRHRGQVLKLPRV